MDNPVFNSFAQHYHDFNFGGNWSWANLKDVLSDVNLEEALTQVDGCNTIGALAYHICYYPDIQGKVLEGGALVGSDKESFSHPEWQDENEWSEFKELVLERAKKFTGLLQNMSDPKLWEVFEKEKYGNYFRNISGMIEHSHYHLGQIVLLKKIIRNRNDNS